MTLPPRNRTPFWLRIPSLPIGNGHEIRSIGLIELVIVHRPPLTRIRLLVLLHLRECRVPRPRRLSMRTEIGEWRRSEPVFGVGAVVGCLCEAVGPAFGEPPEDVGGVFGAV